MRPLFLVKKTWTNTGALQMSKDRQDQGNNPGEDPGETKLTIEIGK
jgi:hypothetical protein